MNKFQYFKILSTLAKVSITLTLDHSDSSFKNVRREMKERLDYCDLSERQRIDIYNKFTAFFSALFVLAPVD